MWKCEKCGHESGRRTSSSGGCDHVWWDKGELENARARQWEKHKAKIARQQEKEAEAIAEMQRKIFEFNDNLWNTEEGLKMLKGEKGWDWLFYEFPVRQPKSVEIYWRDSAFGTEWFRSEYGQQYLDYVKSRYQTGLSVENLLGFLGVDWLQTEQGKQYLNTLQAAESKKFAWISEDVAKQEVENKKSGWLVLIIIFFLYFFLMAHLMENREATWLLMSNTVWVWVMVAFAALMWLGCIADKEYFFVISIPILFVLSSWIYGKLI